MSDALVTDLYEVTMALSYLREGMTAPATFSLFVRKPPPERGFLVAAGLASALDHLTELRVDETDVAAFAEVMERPYTELEPLLGLRFTGEVRAVPEGRVFLPGEPLLEVTAPLPQAQFVESYLLNQVCHQSAVASKAARCVLAADGRPVVDFSLRRTQGVPAGAQAARLGALVGFAGTSNVAAAHAYALRAVGTMAHSYVEAFGDEAAAFLAFTRAHPGPVTFLVDTYDTARGVAVAARVLRESGLHEGCAVRLDSGDLGALAVTARRILDEAGLPGVRITASGGLDEYGIDRLVRSGAPIDLFAVGTLVGVSADAPYLDAAYKLVAYDGQPMMKLSTGKVTAPGAKQVFRGPGLADTIALRDEPAPAGTAPLLRTVMAGGERTSPPGTLAEARAAFAADLALLPPSARRIRSPQLPTAAVSERLAELTADVRRRIERRIRGAR
ncbi:nicotinate phosphoribosyltransferase [Streptomyces sp. FH025]|uniref:nicotinate phosphoribosyltransferase n=1 Tax=Streptomyces sp. FH025 TaxID=2815937 RepID=UPI001A9E6466|nr:nicotinate phosphoribosyltransferase [Streptomyces sp. FH025]MBO1417720.1 nicotinate phosphoribosyltransferase [Streptomyces sp. FH025]